MNSRMIYIVFLVCLGTATLLTTGMVDLSLGPVVKVDCRIEGYEISVVRENVYRVRVMLIYHELKTEVEYREKSTLSEEEVLEMVRMEYPVNETYSCYTYKYEEYKVRPREKDLTQPFVVWYVFGGIFLIGGVIGFLGMWYSQRPEEYQVLN